MLGFDNINNKSHQREIFASFRMWLILPLVVFDFVP